MRSEFRIVVLADVHYDPAPQAPHPTRRSELGCELVRRALEDAHRRGGFDCIALLGDLLNDGRAPHAAQSLAAVREQIDQAAPGVPLMAMPGNHDRETGTMLAAWGLTPGLHELGGFRFVVFVDEYADDDSCTRNEAGREMLKQLAKQDGGPIVVLQHNPMNPVIESDYPYMLTNRGAVMHDYEQAGVLLSVSGHYHPGQELSQTGGVKYYTAPALSEAPFRYALVALAGRNARVETRRLALRDRPAIWDGHAHTEFAYCAEDVTAEAVIHRARTFGLAGICLTEHAPQLYCPQDGYWRGRHIPEPRLWRDGGRDRMSDFFQRVGALRGEFVRVGLEVELDADGELTVLDEDRPHADLLVGAVHWLAVEEAALSDTEAAELFMKTTEGLLRAGVDILAHPFRYFVRRRKHKGPPELHAPLAALLAETRTAAEINFHVNEPDPAFFAECVARGVKIALGSDAHALHEVANFKGHLALLRSVAPGRNVDEILWRPPQGREPAPKRMRGPRVSNRE